MFAAYCPTHRSEILLGYRRLVGVRNTATGIDVHLLCYCGEHLVVPTGRARSGRGGEPAASGFEEPAWSADIDHVPCPA